MVYPLWRRSLCFTLLIYSSQLVFARLHSAKNTKLRLLSSELTYIYFIGDLHGDEKCAKASVRRTNLVNITSAPYQWTGNLDTDAIVFLGDYVDKGPMSRAVMEFVRRLQEMFPDNVVAMLGNHDYERLYDLALSPIHEDASRFPSYDSIHFKMHPEEYLNSGWSRHRSDDGDIIVAIHKALQSVYEQGQKNVYMCVPPLSKCLSYHVDLFTEFPPFNSDLFLAKRTRHRIAQWRKEYSDGMAKSGLLSWLGSRPTVAIIGDALVAHGGVSPYVIQTACNHSIVNNLTLSVALNEVTNKRFHDFWKQQAPHIKDAGNSITEPLPYGAFHLVDDLLEYRGYFDGESDEVRSQQCEEVNHVLRQFDNINRIVIGHTPNWENTEHCNGKLLITDSMLSRFFRAYNTKYCPCNEDIRQKLKEENITLIPICEGALATKCKGTISSISRSSPSDPWLTNSEHIRISFTPETEEPTSQDSYYEPTSIETEGSEVVYEVMKFLSIYLVVICVTKIYQPVNNLLFRIQERVSMNVYTSYAVWKNE